MRYSIAFFLFLISSFVCKAATYEASFLLTEGIITKAYVNDEGYIDIEGYDLPEFSEVNTTLEEENCGYWEYIPCWVNLIHKQYAHDDLTVAYLIEISRIGNDGMWKLTVDYSIRKDNRPPIDKESFTVNIDKLEDLNGTFDFTVTRRNQTPFLRESFQMLFKYNK
ncbi:MAG: hypothetical protein CMK92_06555 [Pseudomonas sp.]|nr:hypothetical protein [Pseudomonas sp.]|tara:strand:- start:392 stop:889 length:498 start_codon:yes stop_codon:yes gene_type:complete